MEEGGGEEGEHEMREVGWDIMIIHHLYRTTQNCVKVVDAIKDTGQTKREQKDLEDQV